MERPGDRLLYSLYLTNFLSSLAFGTVIYLLPVYAEGVGTSYYDLGGIGGVGNAVYTASLLTGFILDVFDRARLYSVSCILGFAVILSFLPAKGVTEIMLVRGLLGRVSAAFWVTTSTIIADASPSEGLTRSMARYNLSWMTAFVVGPFLGGIMSESFGFPFLFVVASVINLVSFVIISAFIRLR